ncbi:hypothetical protein BDV93DRAFT_506186 [Ceratobasidium sp. AG-I]|nr:hypothetical protein BDV93DRAFT_506186 [Ceratobasidium sp. AG-I]
MARPWFVWTEELVYQLIDQTIIPLNYAALHLPARAHVKESMLSSALLQLYFRQHEMPACIESKQCSQDLLGTSSVRRPMPMFTAFCTHCSPLALQMIFILLCLGQCRVYATVDQANEEMGRLCFPNIGWPELAHMNVTVTEEVTEVVTDYRSPVAEYGVIWCTLLCRSDELESYEVAVLGESNDSDMECSV